MPESPPAQARHDRFIAIYDAHYHRILGYAQRRCSAEDAFDVVAETFTVAWRRLADVPDGEQTIYWLYGTARRVLANHRRSLRRHAHLLAALEAEPQPASGMSATVERRRAAAALAKLREDDRELLLLLAWEGLDVAAIAAVVRCSRNAARVRLHRARRRFAAALAAVDGDPQLRDEPRSEDDAGQLAVTPATLRLEDRP